MILGTVLLTTIGCNEWAVQSTEGAYLCRQPAYQDGIKIVAVAGRVKDWAAYAGSRNAKDQDIAEMGDKIGEAAARSLFGWLLHLDYRS